MLEEYDFSNGIRAKYAKRYKEGVNIVKLDSDVTKFFPMRSRLMKRCEH